MRYVSPKMTLVITGVIVGLVLTLAQGGSAAAAGDGAPSDAGQPKTDQPKAGQPKAGQPKAGQPKAAAKAHPKAGHKLPLEQLRTFVEILNRVKQGYVEKISDQKLLENAIRGMLDGLDPHSAYLDKAQYKQMSITTSGKFGGLGLQVQMENGFVRVISPIDDTPASKAGIEPGDEIVRIDGTAVKSLSLMKSVKKMRGDPGSKITLTILRDGRDKPFKVTLKRAVIHVQNVKSRLLGDGYGYIRITQFASDTGDNLRTKLKSLQHRSDSDLKGLVLDLRNNPGGVLDAAVTVADTFLDSGQIVSIRGRAPNTDHVFHADAGDLLDDAPLVVLINQGSASASEIVAGALQDNDRAIIMGHRSFGKGSVQTVIPLKNGAALKLTTARYYTPSGRSIQAEGIDPDVKIQNVSVTASGKTGIKPFSEADLPGALKNDTDTHPHKPKTKREKAEQKKRNRLAQSDYALYEALNLLKGLHIMRARSNEADSAGDNSNNGGHTAPDAPPNTARGPGHRGPRQRQPRQPRSQHAAPATPAVHASHDGASA